MNENIPTQNWAVLDSPSTNNLGTYEFSETFEKNGSQGVFAVVTEALPSYQSDIAYYSLYQRSEQGAEIAIEAAQQAFEDLQERDLDFETSFLDLLAKHWHNKISLHFIANPIAEKTPKNTKGQEFTLSDKSNHGLCNLTNLYDTTISIVQLIDQKLMIYQIGYAQLLLLDKQHDIQINTPIINPQSSFPQFLAHPKISETYHCQTIDTNDYELEMLILLSRQYASDKTTQQLHTEAYKLSRILDTKGESIASAFLQEKKGEASRVVMKRSRRWYDGLSSALDRETHHLHSRIDQQSQQIYKLEDKIYQLHQSALLNQSKSESTEETTDTRKKFTLSLPTLAFNAFALVTTASTIGYYYSNSQHQSAAQPPSIIGSDVYTGSTEEYRHALPRQLEEDNFRALPVSFPVFSNDEHLSLSQPRTNRQAQIQAKASLDTKLQKKMEEEAYQKARKTIKAEETAKANAILKAEAETTSRIEASIKEEQAGKLKAKEIEKEKQLALLQAKSTERKEKARLRQQKEAKARAEENLENIKKQAIAQEIVNHSTAFANNVLQLKKKSLEIKAMDELYSATKNQHYSKQKQLLERRKLQLNQKLSSLSLQYSKQLKRLCSYRSPFTPTLGKDSTRIEYMALKNLKQQLANCARNRNISATRVRKMLRNNYQKLALND